MFYTCFQFIGYVKGVRRGREGSYPASPRTNPGVRNYRTGLFRDTRFRMTTRVVIKSLFPANRLAQFVRPKVRVVFPLRVAYPCQLLPHVNGVTVSEYYELIRPPPVFGFPTCRFGLPTCLAAGTFGSPKFLSVSLKTCHAFCEPRQTLKELTKAFSLCWFPYPLRPSPSAFMQ